MMKRILLSTVLVLGFSTAQGGFLIEPNVGFAVQGTWDNGATDESMTMTQIGSRVGFMTGMGFMFGADLQYGTGTYKAGGTTFLTDVDTTNLDLGLFAGYQSMFGIRGYASYMLSSASDFDDTAGTKITGTGLKFGVGYRIVQYFAVNLEYHLYTYDEFENNLGSGSIDPKFKTNLIMVNASFPINLL